jgi:hypothetical protein
MTRTARTPRLPASLRRGNPEPLSAGLLCTVVVSTWLDGPSAGPEIAFLLLARPPTRRRNEAPDHIEQQLLDLCAALSLAPAEEKLRDTGDRLLLLSPTSAILTLDDSPLSLRLPPVGAEWAGFVDGGGPVYIVLGLDPLRVGASRAETDAYLRSLLSSGRALMGLTTVRRSSPRAGVTTDKDTADSQS